MHRDKASVLDVYLCYLYKVYTSTMAGKTTDEIYQYVYDFKSKLKDGFNEDQEKLFDQSNKAKLQLSSQLIVFSSLLLSIVTGYLLSNVDQLNLAPKNLIMIAVFSFALSIAAGLYCFYSASEFWLKWARHTHDKGGLVHRDESKTVEELDVLLSEIADMNDKMPESNSPIPSYAQAILFLIGLVFVVITLLRTTYSV
ncbi:MAG: hypothetical protein JWL85_137 [Candidatus Saccharibacteria bacterium]|nr:hypothetical protein [Candidatus Saccharibacteria bacterium]